MKPNLSQIWRPMLPVMILGAVAPHLAWTQVNRDRSQEVKMALDQYAEAKTDDQRTAVIDYLRHLDQKLVAATLIDQIIASRNGTEATFYSRMVQALNPDASAALLDRLEKTDDPTAKGKLIVALRHCQGGKSLQALEGCLDDKRLVLFESHGSHPRRVCDLAYDELFLKLRNDSHYGLDASPRMNGIITEKMPMNSRDTLIVKLKAKLAEQIQSPAPSPAREPVKPATAAITL